MRLGSHPALISGLAALALAWTPTESRASYIVTNLVSDIAGLAANTDANLKNPWGVALSPTGPFWTANQGTSTSTIYDSAGTPQSLVVTAGGGPTGIVYNGDSSAFQINGASSKFVYDNLSGQIMGWTGGSSTTATVAVSNTGAVYTGLATASVGNQSVLYAADTVGNKIDVYSSNFTNLNSTSFAGKFTDAKLAAAGYDVFNVQTIGNDVYVTYGNPSNGFNNLGTNGGAVAEFDLSGNLIHDFFNGPGGALENPWGVVLAPKGFGQFGGDLLIGNDQNGQLNAYDPTTGAYLGNVATINGGFTDSTSNGLWGLTFGNGGSGGDPNTLYALAGINNEADGLIVAITPGVVPEPGSALLLTLGAGCVLAIARLRRASSRA